MRATDKPFPWPVAVVGVVVVAAAPVRIQPDRPATDRTPRDLLRRRLRARGDRHDRAHTVGNVIAHSSTCMPPIDPPITECHAGIAEVVGEPHLRRAPCRESVTTGNRLPYGLPSTGCGDAGPVEPWQPPSTLAHTTNHRSVSIAMPGPDHALPPAGAGWPCPIGPAAWLSPVHAWHSRTALLWLSSSVAPRLVGDGHIVEGDAAVERERGGVKSRNCRWPTGSPARHAPLAGMWLARHLCPPPCARVIRSWTPHEGSFVALQSRATSPPKQDGTVGLPPRLPDRRPRKATITRDASRRYCSNARGVSSHVDTTHCRLIRRSD